MADIIITIPMICILVALNACAIALCQRATSKGSRGVRR